MGKMTWHEAILVVLGDADEPMNFADIAEEILARDLVETSGATPNRTVNSVISNSIKVSPDSPFERVTRGMYRLRSSSGASSPAESVIEGVEAESDDPQQGLVTSFGMYWSRERTLWSPAQLLGQLQPQSTPVDFAQQHGVYLLHDRREVVYAGRATQQGLGPRIGQHTVDRLNGRWDRYSWFGVHPVNDDGTLDLRPRDSFSLDGLIEVMEALLIEGLEPRQNRKRGDGFKAFEFIQSENPELERRRREALREDLKRSL